jgi:hypothetical protein
VFYRQNIINFSNVETRVSRRESKKKKQINLENKLIRIQSVIIIKQTIRIITVVYNIHFQIPKKLNS